MKYLLLLSFAVSSLVVAESNVQAVAELKSLDGKAAGIVKFEQLNIWHIPFLKKLFINKIKRNPKTNFLNKIIFYLFVLKQIYKQGLTIIK